MGAENLIRAICYTIILAGLIVILAGKAKGENTTKAVKITTFSLDLMKIKNNRDPMLADIPSEEFGYHVAMNTGLEVWSTLFYNSSMGFETAYSKVMAVGWEYNWGIHLFPYLDLFAHHHSRHSADRPNSAQLHPAAKNIEHRFPVEDFYGIRINFLGNTGKGW